jgi:hypothetical protein
MKIVTTILGLMLMSLTAVAGPADSSIYETLTKVGVNTDLSPSANARILLVDSIQCRNNQASFECYVSDTSNHGLQLAITGNEAKLVYALLSSVFRAPSFYETTDSNDLLVVRGVRCAQSTKEGIDPLDRTSCFAKLGRANQRDLNWGNPLDFVKILNEK